MDGAMSKKVSYIDFERKILFSLVAKYKEILENKKTDSSTVHRKQQAWQKITFEYNRHPNVRKRLTKQLKRLWENTKARAKKEPSVMKAEISENMTNVIEDCTLDSGRHNNDLNFMKSDVPNYADIFVNGDQNENNTTTEEYSRENKRRRKDDASMSGITDGMYDSLLSPIVQARLKKVEESLTHQRELHQITMQREQLQIKALEDTSIREQQRHQCLLERERELHDLTIKHEKELQQQRLRHEQELHQLKLAEYNKVQTASYPILYK